MTTTTGDTELDRILATAKAKIVSTMNATNVAPNSKEIELTQTGAFTDGDMVNVKIDNLAYHPLYSGVINGFKVQLNQEVSSKIEVGTPISLLAYPEAKTAIQHYINKARINEAGQMLGVSPVLDIYINKRITELRKDSPNGR